MQNTDFDLQSGFAYFTCMHMRNMNLNTIPIVIWALFLIGCQPEQPITEERSGLINVNHNELYYNISGRGDTIVILHGGPGFSHQYMKPQLDSLLSSHFTLLYYDQRGSGWSTGEKDTLRLNVENFVEDLEQIRDHFKLAKLNLLGHSFGGLLGMYYSIQYPQKVKSLILVDPDAASYELRTPYQIKMIDSRLTEEQELFLDSLENTESFLNYDPAIHTKYYKTFLTTYFANPDDTAKLYLGFDSISIPKLDHTNQIVRRNLGNYDIHGQLPKIKSKTLIMQGTESVFSVEGARAIHSRIPNSEIHLFDDCGHFEYIEAPDQFKNLILDFYDKKL